MVKMGKKQKVVVTQHGDRKTVSVNEDIRAEKHPESYLC